MQLWLICNARGRRWLVGGGRWRDNGTHEMGIARKAGRSRGEAAETVGWVLQYLGPSKATRRLGRPTGRLTSVLGLHCAAAVGWIDLRVGWHLCDWMEKLCYWQSIGKNLRPDVMWQQGEMVKKSEKIKLPHTYHFATYRKIMNLENVAS